MKTNNNPEELILPDNINNEGEKEYFEQLKKAFDIAHEKNIPILMMSAYEDINRAFLAVQGSKHLITSLFMTLFEKYPEMIPVIQVALMEKYLNRQKDIQLEKAAKKLTPQGN